MGNWTKLSLAYLDGKAQLISWRQPNVPIGRPINVDSRNRIKYTLTKDSKWRTIECDDETLDPVMVVPNTDTSWPPHTMKKVRMLARVPVVSGMGEDATGVAGVSAMLTP